MQFQHRLVEDTADGHAGIDQRRPHPAQHNRFRDIASDNEAADHDLITRVHPQTGRNVQGLGRRGSGCGGWGGRGGWRERGPRLWDLGGGWLVVWLFLPVWGW